MDKFGEESLGFITSYLANKITTKSYEIATTDT